MNTPREVSVRELQHNLASYLNLAKIAPLSITKYGKNEVIIVNPKDYVITKKKAIKQVKKDLMNSPFIGMHKNRKDWKGKTSVEIASKLRSDAWYGK
jgi:hypothetical protein